MSYVLKLNGVEVARTGSWFPERFSRITGTSYPETIPDGWTWEHDGYVLQWEVDPVAPPPTLDELKASKLSDIEREFNDAMAVIKAGYPADEILSWDKQEAEARAWLADGGAPTPMIDAMLLQRTSLNKTELATRIVAKAEIAAGIVGTLVGKRQALEDQIADATLETIGAITW